MTNLDTLDQRAKHNGFATSFAWMFVHEYLHGAVWEETRDKQKAAELVHVWEAAGMLKQKLTEHLEKYDRLKQQVTLLQRIIKLIKQLL
jgi:redox-regulated HSP33 family molecular chaperone